MHKSVHTFVALALGPSDVRGKTVLECGSYNVNGSVKPYITALSPASYVGTDMRDGPDVDVVCKTEELADTFTSDVVVSAEMLEHCENWEAAFKRMSELARETLIVTARGGNFPWHDYPGDYWRFSCEDMIDACRAVGFEPVMCVPDPQAPGVFLKAVRGTSEPTNEWPTPLTTEQGTGRPRPSH